MASARDAVGHAIKASDNSWRRRKHTNHFPPAIPPATGLSLFRVESLADPRDLLVPIFSIVGSRDQGAIDGRYWYGIRYAYEATPGQRREVQRRCEGLRLTIPSEEPVPRYTPFWREFDGKYEFAPAEYSNWEASVKPWLDMTNGVMTKNLLAAAKRIDLRQFADR